MNVNKKLADKFYAAIKKPMQKAIIKNANHPDLVDAVTCAIFALTLEVLTVTKETSEHNIDVFCEKLKAAYKGGARNAFHQDLEIH